jgi:serine/threonine-protein kinase RsbW
MPDTKTVNAAISITSRFENIELAERVVHDLMVSTGIGDEEIAPVIRALWEGIANAIRHGNGGDPDRRVEIEATVSPALVQITIADQGAGFDVAAVPDPTAAENLLKPSGRGIFIMRQLMDRVEFSNLSGGGTVLLLERRLGTTQEREHHEV